MQTKGNCKRCRGVMAVLDLFLEGYDLVCMRCGIREKVMTELSEAPPCYQ